MKAVFLVKKTALNFLTFRNLNNLFFFAKPQLKRKKNQRIKSFDTDSTASLLFLTDFEKKTSFFREKTKLRTCLSNLSISVAFYGKFAITR